MIWTVTSPNFVSRVEVRAGKVDPEHAEDKVAPSLLNLFTMWLVLLRKRFLEKKHKKMRVQLKFCRTMRNDIMQKAPGMRFVYIYSIL